MLYDFKPSGRLYAKDMTQYILAKVQEKENKVEAKAVLENLSNKTETLVRSKFNLLNPKEPREIDGSGAIPFNHISLNPISRGIVNPLTKPAFKFNR